MGGGAGAERGQRGVDGGRVLVNEYNRSLPARAESAWGCRAITNQDSLFDVVRATPRRSAGYLYVRAYLVPELVAEPFAEAEGDQS